MSSTTNVMSEFSQSNAKLMATALFFEYLVYAAFSIIDSYQKEGPEYVYLDENMAEEARKNKERSNKEKDAKKAKAQQEKNNKKAEKEKAKMEKKKGKGGGN